MNCIVRGNSSYDRQNNAIMKRKQFSRNPIKPL